MDEGLGYALVPIFVIVLPIITSSIILYFSLRDKMNNAIKSNCRKNKKRESTREDWKSDVKYQTGGLS